MRAAFVSYHPFCAGCSDLWLSLLSQKSNDPARLAQNLNHTDFDLTKEQLNKISALNINLRFNNPVGISPLLSIFA